MNRSDVLQLLNSPLSSDSDRAAAQTALQKLDGVKPEVKPEYDPNWWKLPPYEDTERGKRMLALDPVTGTTYLSQVLPGETHAHNVIYDAARRELTNEGALKHFAGADWLAEHVVIKQRVHEYESGARESTDPEIIAALALIAHNKTIYDAAGVIGNYES